MKIEIKIPSMGESITEATIGEILKINGSIVALDEEILELETDKVNQVLYAPSAGLLHLNVQMEQTVKIGEVIGFIDTDQKGEITSNEKKEKRILSKEKEMPIKEVIKEEDIEKARIFKEEYIEDLRNKPIPKEIQNISNVEKKIPEELAKNPSVTPKGDETRKRMSKLRQVISKKLVEVKQQSAMLTTFNEIDMYHVMEIRKKFGENFLKNHDVKLGFMSFFITAVVSALKEFPEINAYIDGNEIVYRNYYDIGVAVGTEKGLIVPVIRNCDKRSFSNLEKELFSLANKARNGNLTISDLEGGGFTITNGGVYGSLLSTPILNGNQSGILGMHSIQKRAVVIEDQIVIRPMMYVALSYDHRIVDGKEAVAFLIHIKNIIEDPSRLILDV